MGVVRSKAPVPFCRGIRADRGTLARAMVRQHAADAHTIVEVR
jgi:hypothetical protein